MHLSSNAANGFQSDEPCLISEIRVIRGFPEFELALD
jgi:hypothetical protein